MRNHWRVVALVAACILPMWGFVAYLSFTSFDSGRQELEQSISVAAQTQLRSVEHEVAILEASLRALATSPNLDHHDYAGFYAQAQEVLHHSAGLNILLRGATGEQVINTLLPFGQKLPVEYPIMFYRVMETAQPVLSDLFIGPVSGKPTVSLSVPVVRDGHVVAVLAMALDAAHLAPFIRAEGYPTSWNGAIIDSTGTIVARIREPEKYVGQKAVPEILEAVRAAPHGVVAVTSLEGTHILAAYSRSSLYGWAFIVAVPRAILEAKLKRALLLSLAGGTGLFVLTFLSAWSLWRSFVASEKAGERSRLLLHHASDGIHILDDKGNVIEASDSFCHMLGYDGPEVIGLNVAAWDETARSSSIAEHITRQLDHPETLSFETRHQRKNGSVLDVEVTASALELFGQHVLFCSARDITARKLAEATLQQANEELEQFAYVASHDLQTPLRNIVSYSQLLEQRYKGRLDGDADDFIGFIVDSGRQMSRLIADLLEYSRIGQAKPLMPLPCDAAVSRALVALGRDVTAAGAEITVGVLPRVLADKSHLVSLFENLLSNALRYRAPDRKLRIAVSAERIDGDLWRFAIADNGVGIEQQYFDKIFDIFQRLDPGRTEGTGIGLTLCRRIVHRFGGTIWLESEPGQGTTFFFTLRDASAAT